MLRTLELKWKWSYESEFSRRNAYVSSRGPSTTGMSSVEVLPCKNDEEWVSSIDRVAAFLRSTHLLQNSSRAALSGIVSVSLWSGAALATVAKQTCFPFLRSASQSEMRFFLISNVLAFGFLHEGVMVDSHRRTAFTQSFMRHGTPSALVRLRFSTLPGFKLFLSPSIP